MLLHALRVILCVRCVHNDLHSCVYHVMSCCVPNKGHIESVSVHTGNFTYTPCVHRIIHCCVRNYGHVMTVSVLAEKLHTTHVCFGVCMAKTYTEINTYLHLLDDEFLLVLTHSLGWIPISRLAVNPLLSVLNLLRSQWFRYMSSNANADVRYANIKKHACTEVECYVQLRLPEQVCMLQCM